MPFITVLTSFITVSMPFITVFVIKVIDQLGLIKSWFKADSKPFGNKTRGALTVL